MLLNGYRLEVFKPACNANFQSLHCLAHLDDDVGEALPYLNAVLGGATYIKEPPSLTLALHGKIVTLHGRKIAINALRDEAEARGILEWLKKEVNDAWENRERIVPKFAGKTKPHILEIYKLLPKRSCRKCGQPSCMMFCSLAAEGIKGPEDCPELTTEGSLRLGEYLGRFELD